MFTTALKIATVANSPPIPVNPASGPDAFARMLVNSSFGRPAKDVIIARVTPA